MIRSITFFLYCLFVGVAMAASQEPAEQARPKRVRRGLINVQKQAEEVNRLSNEFGEGDERDLQEEEIELIMAEDMSFSFEEYSMSYMPMPVEESGSEKGGKKGKSRRKF